MQDAGRGGLSTRGIVISAVLAAVAIFLGATRLGFIPTPTGIAATIMHVPAIIGGVLEGPVVGAIIGTIFGLYSFFYATVGTATNTVLVLGFGTARHYLPVKAAWVVGITHGIPEIVVAVILSLAVLLPWKRVHRGQARARV